MHSGLVSADLGGSEVLSSNVTHLVPVAVTETRIEESSNQRQMLFELVHSIFHLQTAKRGTRQAQHNTAYLRIDILHHIQKQTHKSG